MAALDEKMSGPYNAVAPHPVSNRDFGRTLARVLKRPAVFRHPEPLLRLIIGEAAVYASGGPRVVSSKVEEAGYRFFFPELEPALQNALRA
jgi:NAD dependent epimerase/dehydratase family enzyme